ncbi:MAG: Isoprenylcysteine carboxyl methyltransferase [Microgenomates group bacterium Gr01-1014_7]|nr:MAG: Isoprenylcysteine carboxyl methyltransferase [Microgenomates group bacterium Gr01-1014_7]
MLVLDIFWTITDPRPFQERMKSIITLTYPRVALTLVPQIVSALFFPLPPTTCDGMIIVFGVFLFETGVLLAVWARLALGVNWNPPSQYSGKRQKKLITKGPFIFTRNPISLGVILIVLGFSIAIKSWNSFLVIFLFLYLRNAVIKEEKLLEKHWFPDFY